MSLFYLSVEYEAVLFCIKARKGLFALSSEVLTPSYGRQVQLSFQEVTAPDQDTFFCPDLTGSSDYYQYNSNSFQKKSAFPEMLYS